MRGEITSLLAMKISGISKSIPALLLHLSLSTARSTSSTVIFSANTFELSVNAASESRSLDSTWSLENGSSTEYRCLKCS